MKLTTSILSKLILGLAIVLSVQGAMAEEQSQSQESIQEIKETAEAKVSQAATAVREGYDSTVQAVSESPIFGAAVESTKDIAQKLEDAGYTPENAKLAIDAAETRAQELGMSVVDYFKSGKYQELGGQIESAEKSAAKIYDHAVSKVSNWIEAGHEQYEDAVKYWKGQK